MAFCNIIAMFLIFARIMSGYAGNSDTCSPGEYQCRTCQDICQKCPVNSYTHVGHFSRCIPCPRYHRTTGEGSTSRLDCALPTKCDHEVDEFIRQCDDGTCIIHCWADTEGNCQTCSTEPFVCHRNRTRCDKAPVSKITETLCWDKEKAVTIEVPFSPLYNDRTSVDFQDLTENITDTLDAELKRREEALPFFKLNEIITYWNITIKYVLPCFNSTKAVFQFNICVTDPRYMTKSLHEDLLRRPCYYENCKTL